MTLADATTARRQLQELTAAGYPLKWLADQLGMSPQGLGGIRSGRQQRSRGYALCSIYRLYRRLQDTTPEPHGIQPGPISYSRVIAARNGWTRSTAA